MGCSASSPVTEPNHKHPPPSNSGQSSHLKLSQQKQQTNTKQNPTIKTKQNSQNGQHFMLGCLNDKQQVFAKVNPQSFSINKMSIPQGLVCYNFSSFIKLQNDNYFIAGGINHNLTQITNKAFIYKASTHTVKQLTPMKQPRYTHSCIYVSERKEIYIFGGRYYGDDSEGILNSCQKYSIKQEKWLQVPLMIVKRCTCFTMLWKNTIYVFGGYTGPYQRSTVIEFLNQGDNKWQKLDVELYRGLQGAMMLSTNPNQVTIFGGLTNSGSTDSVVTINFKNKSIIAQKKLTTQRSLYKGFVKQRQLYIFGGDEDFSCQCYNIEQKNSEKIDKQFSFSNDSFDSLAFSTQSVVVPYLEQKPQNFLLQTAQTDEIVHIFGTTEEPFICSLNVSIPRAQFRPVPLPLKLYAYQGGMKISQSQILLFGGIENHSYSVITSDTFLYDLKKQTVTKTANMNQNRYAFAYQLTKNHLGNPQYVYCFGGATSNTQGKLVFLSSCERYNIKQNKWQLIAPLPKKLISPMSLIYNERIFVFGGTDSQNKKNKNIYTYNYEQNQWITLKSLLPFGIQGGSLVQVQKNQFYIFGGLLQNGQSSGIWSLHLNVKKENKKQEYDFVFYEKGQMNEKKSQHKIYKPRNQEFYVVFGGSMEVLSFYDKQLKEEKSDRLYNLKRMFVQILQKFNEKSLKGYLILG